MNDDELLKRLTALEDLEAIRRLHQEYISCLDNLEFDRALDFFTDDAEVEVRNSGVLKGKKNFARIYVEVLAKRKERHDGHLAVQPVLTVDGDTARGHWTIYMLLSVPEIDWVQGRNDCEYRKVDGAWKISKLKFTRTLASSPELFP